MGCGVFAGLCSQSVTYPIDVVRRRIQIDGFDTRNGYEEVNGRGGGGKEKKVARRARCIYKGMDALKVMKTVWKNEGRRGLTKGLSVNWVKGPIATAISFSMFEFLKKEFGIKT